MRSPGNKLSMAREKIVGAWRRDENEASMSKWDKRWKGVERERERERRRGEQGSRMSSVVNLWTYFSRRVVAINPAL